jgi:hypothetical protein
MPGRADETLPGGGCPRDPGRDGPRTDLLKMLYNFHLVDEIIPRRLESGVNSTRSLA